MAIGYRWHGARFGDWPRAIFLAGARGRRRVGAPRLAPREHPLLRDTDTDGGHYVATERALYHRGASEPAWQRIAWIDVASVDRSGPTRTLTLRSWPEADSLAIAVPVRDHCRLPAFALERVTACQIITRRVGIAAGCAITVTTQQEADTVTWTVRLDPGCPRYDPALTIAIDRILRELRGQTGC
jgi:hypothetical protein